MEKENKKTLVELDFYNMILNSWTYEKLTQEERKQYKKTMFEDVRTEKALKGTYKQRWEILQAIYSSFLNGCGYDGPNWRYTEEEKETF